jgi:hypothetical protein
VEEIKMATSATQSARDCAEITPSDTEDLPREARGIYVGVGGDLKITTQYKNTVTFRNLVRGQILPVQVWKIWQTGTTAGSLIALY